MADHRAARANTRPVSLTLDETALTLPPNLVLARAFLRAQLNGKQERASARYRHDQPVLPPQR
jgi:hypothetical protein